MNYEPTGLMEPMFPEGSHKELEDLVFDLIQKSSALASQIHPIVQASVGDLVRSMKEKHLMLIHFQKNIFFGFIMNFVKNCPMISYLLKTLKVNSFF
ncbi:MAG: hypothetical protein O9264_08110 [Leptospira sp.]|jgi:hypothetical protein|nr:hypothetical protein [Leptospira sp.]